MQQILLIQTAFTGDVVLITGLLEKLHTYQPGAAIDILVRKGNESLFHKHPFVHEVLVWDKRRAKYRNLLKILQKIRHKRYDLLINVQRYTATGLITVLSKAKHTIGFDKNPFSFLFTEVIRHVFGGEEEAVHEIERNHQLISSITDDRAAKPKLYPSAEDEAVVDQLIKQPYICIAPASVWFTKQLPAIQWIRFLDSVPASFHVYLIGAPADRPLCELIRKDTGHPDVQNLAGKLSFLQSAALMKKAVMNYVNDSAPMHFASAVNAPVTVVYCSTIPAFGYRPLSTNSHIVEVTESLPCRPCGLHGKKACPLVHFNCARFITNNQLLDTLS
ncbi:MAG: glycosyltransferase family 9 protein [Sediminibacterium sp.]